MKFSQCRCLLSTACMLLALADAREQYVTRIPNGANVQGVAAIGHVDTSGGGTRNAFGMAFAENDLAWTVALCQADSDGDGQTNGQELGDPCCEWKEGGTPKFTTGVSAPGDATSKADPSLWASAACAGGAAASPASNATTPAATTATPAPAASSSASGFVPTIATSIVVCAVALAQL